MQLNFFDDSWDLAVKQAILHAASNDVDACKKAGLQTWKIVGLSRLKSLKPKKNELDIFWEGSPTYF